MIVTSRAVYLCPRDWRPGAYRFFPFCHSIILLCDIDTNKIWLNLHLYIKNPIFKTIFFYEVAVSERTKETKR